MKIKNFHEFKMLKIDINKYYNKYYFKKRKTSQN